MRRLSNRRRRCPVPALISINQACFETLELRRMLCVLTSELGGEHVDSHIPATEFVQLHPEFAGKDLWDVGTFDPHRTGDVRKFLYDPHMIEDDRPVIEE